MLLAGEPDVEVVGEGRGDGAEAGVALAASETARRDADGRRRMPVIARPCRRPVADRRDRASRCPRPGSSSSPRSTSTSTSTTRCVPDASGRLLKDTLPVDLLNAVPGRRRRRRVDLAEDRPAVDRGVRRPDPSRPPRPPPSRSLGHLTDRETRGASSSSPRAVRTPRSRLELFVEPRHREDPRQPPADEASTPATAPRLVMIAYATGVASPAPPDPGACVTVFRVGQRKAVDASDRGASVCEHARRAGDVDGAGPQLARSTPTTGTVRADAGAAAAGYPAPALVAGVTTYAYLDPSDRGRLGPRLGSPTAVVECAATARRSSTTTSRDVRAGRRRRRRRRRRTRSAR